MKKIIILGSGLVGHAIARDLSKEYEVHAVDLNRKILESVSNVQRITTVHADLSDTEKISELVRGFDVAVNALPGFMGFQAIKAIINAKVNLVDIAFSPEDPLVLDDLARKNNVTAVVDCGVAPGLCNIMLGHESLNLDSIHSYICLVGGLPVERYWPFEYKAGFSPVDVIEEYTRPSRYKEDGKIVVKPALSDLERIDFRGVGTLEAFNTDGLRTLLTTMDIPNMREKTLRYPGHVKLMEIFRETGFLSTSAIKFQGRDIRPLDFTARILFPQWELSADEADFTIMRVIIEGKKQGKTIKKVYDLFDQYDPDSRTTSMARTTGYTCSGAVRILAEKKFSEPGICPPECFGQKPGIFNMIRQHLAERHVHLLES